MVTLVAGQCGMGLDAISAAPTRRTRQADPAHELRRDKCPASSAGVTRPGRGSGASRGLGASEAALPPVLEDDVDQPASDRPGSACGRGHVMFICLDLENGGDMPNPPTVAQTAHSEQLNSEPGPLHGVSVMPRRHHQAGVRAVSPRGDRDSAAEDD